MLAQFLGPFPNAESVGNQPAEPGHLLGIGASTDSQAGKFVGHGRIAPRPGRAIRPHISRVSLGSPPIRVQEFAHAIS